MTERFCDYCLSCRHDCKRKSNINECVNYTKAITLDEYKEMIREQNTNIRRLCKDKNLKYYIMLDILKGKMPMKFKYAAILDEHLFEKNEFLPYVDKGVIDN